MYSIEALHTALSDEALDEEHLELLLMIANGCSAQEIAEQKEITPNAFRKRMGPIYIRLGIEGGRGKLDKLRTFLETKLNPEIIKNKTLVTYFSDFEKDLVVTLIKKFLSGEEDKFLFVNNPINLGKPWKEEVEEKIKHASSGIALFLPISLEMPLANSAVGFLSGILNSFKFVNLGGQVPEDLLFFEWLNGSTSKDLLSLRKTLLSESNLDPEQWINYCISTEGWSEKIIEKISVSREEHYRSVKAKFIESEEFVKQISSLLDDETYQYEHKIVEGMIHVSAPQLHSWLPKISASLVKEMRDLKEEYLVEELAHQNYPIVEVESPSLEIRKNHIDSITKNLKSPIQQEEFPICVCVLRVIQDDSSFKQKSAASTEDISFSNRDTQDRRPGEGFVQIVAAGRKPVSVRSIDQNLLISFKNRDWIQENRLHSFISFPIFTDTEVNGILSFYGYRDYAIYDNPEHLYFIDCLVYLISRLLIKLNKMKALKTLLSLNKEQFGDLNLLSHLPDAPDRKIKRAELMQRFFSYG